MRKVATFVLVLVVVFSCFACTRPEVPGSVAAPEVKPVATPDPAKDCPVLTEMLPDGAGLFVTSVEDKGASYLVKGIVYEKYTLTMDEYENVKKTKKLTLAGKEYEYEAVDEKDAGGSFGPFLVVDGKIEFIGKEREFCLSHKNGGIELMSLYEGGTLPRKPSGECRQVEVDKSTLFQSTWVNYTTTARDAFEDLEIEQPTDDPFIEPLFNFLFENGRCVKVGEYPYFSAVECV